MDGQVFSKNLRPPKLYKIHLQVQEGSENLLN